jgi:hypothetical protein
VTLQLAFRLVFSIVVGWFVLRKWRSHERIVPSDPVAAAKSKQEERRIQIGWFGLLALLGISLFLLPLAGAPRALLANIVFAMKIIAVAYIIWQAALGFRDGWKRQS